MIRPNRFANYIHNKMKRLGFYDNIREDGTILLLIVTEISKLNDKDRLNKNEKLADITMRLYDFCGYKKIYLNGIYNINKYEPFDMIDSIVNEFEATRVDMNTGLYITECLNMCYKYALKNNIDLNKEIIRKCRKLNKIKRFRKF